MTGIYTYSVAILMGVAVFGAILGLMRILNNRRLHLAQGVIQGLENAALTDLGEQDLPERGLREEEGLPARPSFLVFLTWLGFPLLSLFPAPFRSFFLQIWSTLTVLQTLEARLGSPTELPPLFRHRGDHWCVMSF